MNTKNQFSNLSGSQKVIFNAHVKFYIQQGFSQTEAEAEGFKKLKKVEDLKKDKSIIRY